MGTRSMPYLKSVNAQVLQQTLKTLDKAFADMKAKGYGFPRFQKVKKASGYYVMIAFQSPESCPDAPVGKISLGIDAGIESLTK